MITSSRPEHSTRIFFENRRHPITLACRRSDRCDCYLSFLPGGIESYNGDQPASGPSCTRAANPDLHAFRDANGYCRVQVTVAQGMSDRNWAGNHFPLMTCESIPTVNGHHPPVVSDTLTSYKMDSAAGYRIYAAFRTGAINGVTIGEGNHAGPKQPLGIYFTHDDDQVRGRIQILEGGTYPRSAELVGTRVNCLFRRSVLGDPLQPNQQNRLHYVDHLGILHVAINETFLQEFLTAGIGPLDGSICNVIPVQSLMGNIGNPAGITSDPVTGIYTVATSPRGTQLSAYRVEGAVAIPPVHGGHLHELFCTNECECYHTHRTSSRQGSHPPCKEDFYRPISMPVRHCLIKLVRADIFTFSCLNLGPTLLAFPA